MCLRLSNQCFRLLYSLGYSFRRKTFIMSSPFFPTHSRVLSWVSLGMCVFVCQCLVRQSRQLSRKRLCICARCYAICRNAATRRQDPLIGLTSNIFTARTRKCALHSRYLTGILLFFCCFPQFTRLLFSVLSVRRLVSPGGPLKSA